MKIVSVKLITNRRNISIISKWSSIVVMVVVVAVVDFIITVFVDTFSPCSPSGWLALIINNYSVQFIRWSGSCYKVTSSSGDPDEDTEMEEYSDRQVIAYSEPQRVINDQSGNPISINVAGRREWMTIVDYIIFIRLCRVEVVEFAGVTSLVGTSCCGWCCEAAVAAGCDLCTLLAQWRVIKRKNRNVLKAWVCDRTKRPSESLTTHVEYGDKVN